MSFNKISDEGRYDWVEAPFSCVKFHLNYYELIEIDIISKFTKKIKFPARTLWTKCSGKFKFHRIFKFHHYLTGDCITTNYVYWFLMSKQWNTVGNLSKINFLKILAKVLKKLGKCLIPPSFYRNRPSLFSKLQKSSPFWLGKSNLNFCPQLQFLFIILIELFRKYCD